LFFNEDETVAAWVAERIPHGCSFRKGEFKAIGVGEDDGEPVAGVVYHNFIPQHRHIEITMAAVSPRWAQRGVIRGLLHYPFEQLGCERITLLVPHDSKRTLKFVRGIGFVHEGTARRGFGDKHACILGMLRKDYLKLLSRMQTEMKKAG
jgi:RimJ/RimL family protein N-acetyltransferase